MMLRPSDSRAEGRVWGFAFPSRAPASTTAAAATLTSVAPVFSWLFERSLALKHLRHPRFQALGHERGVHQHVRHRERQDVLEQEVLQPDSAFLGCAAMCNHL